MKKTALVSGANRGLGLALCRQLLDDGYDVFGLCRRTSKEMLELDIGIIDDVDISDIEQIQTAMKRFPHKIDLLINNAGIGLDDKWDDMDFGGLQKQFMTNAFGPLCLSHACTPRIERGGKIIFISSRMSSIADNVAGASYAYRMSKAALNMLGRNLSIDLKDRGIAVGVLSPGQVDTDMLRALGITTGREASAVAKDLLLLINRLDLKNTGSFWRFDGQVVAW